MFWFGFEPKTYEAHKHDDIKEIEKRCKGPREKKRKGEYVRNQLEKEVNTDNDPVTEVSKIEVQRELV